MKRTSVFLTGIVILGAILRLVNLSPFTIYPDSYQNLIVAENIKTYTSVVGYLGQNGMLYPDYFMWTRPLFPLLINAVSFFGMTPLIAGRGIAFVLGIGAIPLSYLFTKTVFSKRSAGLITAFLIALSYNLTIWSGLVMTEAIGVFFMLLFLWSFFASVDKKPTVLRFQNILTGVFFAFAVLSRYEYVLIAIPIVLYSVKKSQRPLVFLTTFFGAFLCVIILTGFLFYPIQSVVQVVVQQLSGLLIKTAIVIGAGILGFSAYHAFPKQVKKRLLLTIPQVLRILLGFFFLVFVILFSFHSSQVFGIDVTMYRDFFRHDIVFSLFAFIGLMKMLEKKDTQSLSYFIILAVVLLGFVYYQINPAMERYITHLIPFLVIVAVYGIQVVGKTVVSNPSQKIRFFLYGILGFIVVSQFLLTAAGLRNLNDASWFQPSYEEQSALLTGQHLRGNPLLITSHPEPYYYFLHYDTQSIADTTPFIYIPKELDKRTVVIVEDMGMRSDFPHFTKILDSRLKKYETARFFVHVRYHYLNNSVIENAPVILYTLPLGMLRKIL